MAWHCGTTAQLLAASVLEWPDARANGFLRQAQVERILHCPFQFVFFEVVVGHRDRLHVANFLYSAVKLVGLLPLNRVDGVTGSALSDDIHVVKLGRHDVVFPYVPDVHVGCL